MPVRTKTSQLQHPRRGRARATDRERVDHCGGRGGVLWREGDPLALEPLVALDELRPLEAVHLLERGRPVLELLEDRLLYVTVPVRFAPREHLELGTKLLAADLEEEGSPAVLDADVEDGEREELHVWVGVREAGSERLGGGERRDGRGSDEVSKFERRYEVGRGR